MKGKIPEKTTIRLSLDVSPQLNDAIETFANILGITKAEALRRAVVLMELAVEGKGRGERMALTKNGQIVTQIAL